MKISDILQEEFVSTRLPGKSKEEVLNSIIDLLRGSKKIKDLDKVRDAIFEREKIMSNRRREGIRDSAWQDRCSKRYSRCVCGNK